MDLFRVAISFLEFSCLVFKFSEFFSICSSFFDKLLISLSFSELSLSKKVSSSADCSLNLVIYEFLSQIKLYSW